MTINCFDAIHVLAKKTNGSQRRKLTFQEFEARFCLSAITLIPHEIGSLPVQIVATADLDGDSDKDLVIAANGGGIFWYEQHEKSFGKWHAILRSSGQDIHGLQIADLDGDGDQDVIAVDSSSRNEFWYVNVYWFENSDGAGSFGIPQLITSDFDARAVLTSDIISAADLDGDGDMDIVAGGGWIENLDGLGTFGMWTSIIDDTGFEVADGFGINIKINSVYPVDIDGDGDLDIIASHSGARGFSSVAWYENTNGRGDFVGRGQIGWDGNRGSQITTADIDNDGDLDIVTAGRRIYSQFEGIPYIVWYENADGWGAFESKLVEIDSFGSSVVAASDIDRDHDVDIIDVRTNNVGDSSYVIVHENLNGQGDFGPGRNVYGANDAYFVAINDIDNDGDLDFISTNRFAWYEQRVIGDSNDDGVFDSRDLAFVFQAGKFEDRIALNSTFDDGDWNGDGEFNSSDIVFAFQSGNYEMGPAARANHIAAVM